MDEGGREAQSAVSDGLENMRALTVFHMAAGELLMVIGPMDCETYRGSYVILALQLKFDRLPFIQS